MFFYLSLDIIDTDCESKIFFNMTQKAVILDPEYTLLLSNLDMP